MKLCDCHRIFSAMSKTKDSGNVQCLKMPKKCLGLLGIFRIDRVTETKNFFRPKQ